MYYLARATLLQAHFYHDYESLAGSSPLLLVVFYLTIINFQTLNIDLQMNFCLFDFLLI